MLIGNAVTDSTYELPTPTSVIYLASVTGNLTTDRLILYGIDAGGTQTLIGSYIYGSTGNITVSAYKKIRCVAQSSNNVIYFQFRWKS